MTVVLLLVRDQVPRLRAYARFSADVAAGRQVRHLGRALDDMVARIDETRRQEAEQAEFVDTLQVTASEEEAHELVQRHLQRSLPDSAVVVLKRNNSGPSSGRTTTPPEQMRERRHPQADGGTGEPVAHPARGRDARPRPLQADQRPLRARQGG
jgi:hypothetical protein